MKKLNIYLLLMVSVFSIGNVKAAPNVKTEDSTDANTKENKCPYSIIVQDNLSGSKDMDFSDLDCMFYKTNENGEKVLREETDNIDFSCLQSFLDKYTNEEFAEATDNRIAEGFPTNNKYCPVYCVEANEFIFPGYSPQINSGGHFTWTVEKDEDRNILDGLTVRLQGTKVCRAQVDLEQWIDDYKDIMEEIIDNIKVTNSHSCGRDCTPDAGGDGKYNVCTWHEGEMGTVTFTVSKSTASALKSQSEINEINTAAFNYWNYNENDYTDMVKNADSNRFYYTFTESSRDETREYYNQTGTVGFITQNASGNFYLGYSSGPSYTFALRSAAKSAGWDVTTGTTAVANTYVKMTEWERTCCTWNPVTDFAWYYTKQTPDLTIEAGTTEGWDTAIDGQYRCNGGDSPANEHNCCSGANVTVCTENANGECIEGTTRTEYKCYVPADKMYYQRKMVLICPTDGTEGTAEDVAIGKPTQCSPASSTRCCPSGYEYSPDGMCYKADVTKIEQLLNKLETLRQQLKQCHDQLIDYDYYLDTDMEIEYNETSDSANNKYFPNNDAAIDTKLIRVDRNTDIDDGENILGEYSSEIVKPSQKSDVSDTISLNGGTYIFDKNSIPYMVCSITGFKKYCDIIEVDAVSDYWYDWFGRAYIAMYEYKLVDNFYRWVKIPSGESVSTKPTGDYLKYNRYIEIGYPNYPVHFATPAGDYEGLNVRIKNVGYKNYLYNEYQGAIREYNGSLSDRDLTSTEQNNELLHDCYYHVTEGEPYCPTVGCDEDEFDLGSVRIIYRPISLENPFPARDGDGRDTGSNWCIINNEDKTSDCSNENENVDKYILNNRNVVGSEVYNKEPMYQITLNPALIKQIREYNKSTNYDDYNLYCSGKDGEEGTECRSHFVVGGMEETNLPSLSSYFENTCGMSSDWDACDKLDGIER